MDHSAHKNHIGVPKGDDMKSMGHDMGHAMAFHFGNMETILFKGWMPETPAGMFFSCIGIIVMCFVMETLRWLRSYRAAQQAMHNPVNPEDRLRYQPTFSFYTLFDGFLHCLQLTLSYCLMLVFMTFNVWLCTATVLGEVVSRVLYNTMFPNLNIQGSTCG